MYNLLLLEVGQTVRSLKNQAKLYVNIWFEFKYHT